MAIMVFGEGGADTLSGNEFGVEIKLSEEEFKQLSEAFFAETKRRFLLVKNHRNKVKIRGPRTVI